jgi:hypothetical protein
MTRLRATTIFTWLAENFKPEIEDEPTENHPTTLRGGLPGRISIKVGNIT